jgi:hypothetical protein
MQLTDDRPTRVNRYSAPPFFPVPALLLVLIPFQLFVHFSSHSIATYVKDTVEGLLGKGFVAASFKFLLGAVSDSRSPSTTFRRLSMTD